MVAWFCTKLSNQAWWVIAFELIRLQKICPQPWYMFIAILPPIVHMSKVGDLWDLMCEGKKEKKTNKKKKQEFTGHQFPHSVDSVRCTKRGPADNFACSNVFPLKALNQFTTDSNLRYQHICFFVSVYLIVTYASSDGRIALSLILVQHAERETEK